jgi:hypothetical protein
VAPRRSPDNNFTIPNPLLVLDVYLLICHNFVGARYSEGIGLLSEIICYLQEIPVLTAAEVPEMPEGWSRIALEFASVDFGQAHNIVSMTGLRSFPFLVYRLRGLPFEGPGFAGKAGHIRAGEPHSYVRVPS